MSRTAYYYKPKLSDDSEIIDVLNELTDKHNRWGFPKCFKRIRKLEPIPSFFLLKNAR